MLPILRAGFGIEANEARCKELVGRSIMSVAALNPIIGYDVGASVAKEALNSGKTISEVVLSRGLMKEDQLDRLLDPRAMTDRGFSSDALKRPNVEGWENEGGHLVQPDKFKVP